MTIQPDNVPRPPTFSGEPLRATTPAYAALIEDLRRAIGASLVAISTTLPRGGLQLVQPREIDPLLLRAYVRAGHAVDAVAWRTLLDRRPVQLSDVAREQGQPRSAVDRLRQDFLTPFGFQAYAASALRGPLLDGYPGVLHVFRATATPLSERELALLGEASASLDDAVALVRADRQAARCGPRVGHNLSDRQFLFDGAGRLLYPRALPRGMETIIAARLREVAMARLADGGFQPAAVDAPLLSIPDGEGGNDAVGAVGERLLVADADGDNWAFRLCYAPSYPALTGDDRPVAIMSLQPQCQSWADLRASDFAADEEVARLIPAIGFMVGHFAHRSTLGLIARTVHLSPFHFHRRFTELLGITPKHFLFDCQIDEAKQQLLREEMGLPQIARHCGFAHQSHFTSRFKQAVGLTPMRWRRMARAKAPTAS